MCVNCLAAPQQSLTQASGASDGAPVDADSAATRSSWSCRAMACLAAAGGTGGASSAGAASAPIAPVERRRGGGRAAVVPAGRTMRTPASRPQYSIHRQARRRRGRQRRWRWRPPAAAPAERRYDTDGGASTPLQSPRASLWGNAAKSAAGTQWRRRRSGARATREAAGARR